MKVLFALAALVALAAAKHGGYHGDQEIVPDLFEGQREYVYNYRSLVATGLPRQSQRYSGLEKYGVLNVQVNEQQGNTKILGLRLRHVMSGSFDKEVEDIENRRIEGVSHSVEETIEKYGPVFVKIQDNEVQKLQAPENMPEEVINIYRGIAAIFTVGKPQSLEGDEHPFMPQEQRYGGEQQPIVYRRQEEGITGNFETIYEIFSNPEQQYNQQLNLTKTRNYMKQMGPDGRMLQNGHDRRGCQNVCPTHKPEQFDKNMEPELSDWMKPTAEGCPVNFHPKTDLVEAFTTYNYNMTVEGEGKFALIHEAQALDKKILPLRKQQIKTVSLIKLQLIEVHPVTESWNKQQATKSYDEITYRFPEGHQYDLQYLSLYNKGDQAELLKDQIIPMIKALAQIIVSENLELKGQTGDKIVQLTMALGSLPKSELLALWQTIGQTGSDKSATVLDKVQRKVLIDTIALSGSNNATELLLDLIMEQKLNTFETVDTLQTFQQNLVKPSIKVMQQLKEIVTGGKFQEKRTILGAASIAFAEVVRTNCATRTHKNTLQHQQQQHLNGEPGHRCGEQEYKQFVEAIRGQLHSAKDFAQLTIYIQTLGRLAHPKAVEALTPYVYGEQEVFGQLRQMHKDGFEDDSEYVQFIRQVAIYALHPAAQKHGAAVQPLVQGIYFDKQQDYELRIAALSVLLATQPTEATFGRIVLELGQEQDLEVASYAYSALNHLANSTLPCMQRTARRVQNVLGGLPEQSFGTHHSKWGTQTLYHQLTNIGMKGQWEVTQSNVSAIPRAAYFSITGNKGPFVSTVAEVSMVSKGLENLYNFIHQKGGMTQIVENVMQRIRRDTRHAVGDQSVEQVLQQIEQAMQFNTEENMEEPRAVVSGSFLGNELYLPIDKEYMTKVGQKVGQQIVQLLSKEGADKTYHYVRILMPRTYVHVAPAVNGLPVILSNRHPIVVSLSLKDLQTRFGAEKGQMKLNPFTLAVSGLIKPTVYHTSIHSALTINPLQSTRYAHGVRAIEQTYVTLPIDAAVQYTHQTKTLAFTLRPRFETVFFHKTRAMTFQTEALLIRGVEKPLIERYTVVKTQQKPFVFDRTLGQKLGMALRVQGMSENEEYAVNFMKHQESFRTNPMASLIKQLSNEWFVPRAWTVRVEQNQQWPAQEMKMVLRLGKSLFQQRAQQENGQQEQQQQQRLTQEQLQKEQAHPEQMRMIAYEQEFEKITGRKPQTQELQQSLKQIAQKTEKFWSQVDRELSQQLQEQNTQVRSIEYIISAKGEKKPVAIHGHIIVAALPSKQARLAELKMKVDQKPISLEIQAVSAYTKTPQPFETEVRQEEQRAILGFVAQLETRSTGKQQYSGKVEMNKSEEQKKLMNAPKEQKPWYYAQCEEDKKEQKSEMSTACEKVRVHKSALNKLRFEIELPQNVHQRLVNASHQIRETLKVRLYRNLRANYVAQQKTQENKIEGELIYSEQYPEMRMANLTIRTPDHEELRFERIALPKALRPSTMWTLKQQVKAALKLDRPEPVCIYNGQNLRTFDNVTVSLKSMKEGEKYIIARDNRQKPLFTILGEKKQAGQQSEIEIVLRDATLLKLTPPTQQTGAVYKVRVNSSTIEVHPKKTEVRQYGPQTKHMIVLHVEEHKEGQDTLVIKVRDQRMRIVYDGKNLKIENAKQMLKGKLTGLCGDMNNQHIEEFTGPEGCNYEREEDFVRSFGLSKENHGLQGKWMCPEGVQPRTASSQDIQKHQQNKQMRQESMQQRYSEQRQNYRDQQQHMTKETKMIPLNGKLCFSTEPVTACQSGRRQLETEMQSVEFVCLNQSHQRTKQLQREVQSQKIASDLPYAGQSGLVHHEVEIPTRCGH